MLLALLNKKLIPPTKNEIAKCPLCNLKVVAKCGEINIHHWAHKKTEGCDSWSEPETYWHKSWKESFPVENREVVIEKYAKKHFADIYTNNQVVIELQNSSISSEIIREREIFYGKRLLWVINAGKYRSHISISINEEMKKIISQINPKSFYYKIYLCNDNINKFLETSNEFTFKWKYPIRSWKNSKRPVFLDINEDYLLWFYQGIGTDYGKFKVYPKHKFFKKYKGDYTKYQELNETENLFDFAELVKIIEDLMWDYDKEFTTYDYPPYPSLKVYDKLSKKTHLQKVRKKELLIPNGNNKGLFFLFCLNLNNPKRIGLYFGQAIDKNIRKSVLEVLYDNKLSNTWKVDYISSIPLNNKDIKNLLKSITNHINSILKLKVDNLKQTEIIKTTHNTVYSS